MTETSVSAVLQKAIADLWGSLRMVWGRTDSLVDISVMAEGAVSYYAPL